MFKTRKRHILDRYFLNINLLAWSDPSSLIGFLLLGELITITNVVIMSNMKAVELICSRILYSEFAFAELVLWRLPEPLEGSLHKFKYRLAYVVRGECVLRYDNETSKGDHRHFGGKESAYIFTTPEKLVADFQNDIARWNNENRNP